MHLILTRELQNGLTAHVSVCSFSRLTRSHTPTKHGDGGGSLIQWGWVTCTHGEGMRHEVKKSRTSVQHLPVCPIAELQTFIQVLQVGESGQVAFVSCPPITPPPRLWGRLPWLGPSQKLVLMSGRRFPTVETNDTSVVPHVSMLSELPARSRGYCVVS